jgi:hypothetical protein
MSNESEQKFSKVEFYLAHPRSARIREIGLALHLTSPY